MPGTHSGKGTAKVIYEQVSFFQFKAPDLGGKKMPRMTVEGRLPGLNEYLTACGRNPKAGGRMKRDAVNDLCNAIRKQVGKWRPKGPIIAHFVFYEPDKRRDKDNITSFFSKCFFDALQRCGVIKNDGWGEIENYTHDFYVDKDRPRVEIFLEDTAEEIMNRPAKEYAPRKPLKGVVKGLGGKTYKSTTKAHKSVSGGK